MRFSALIAMLALPAMLRVAMAASPPTSQAVRVDAPPGFVVEQVAGEPHVRFPMFACFDDRGRLFVTESSGLDLYDELQKQTRKCRVSMLEDKDGDGRFETATVFAEKLVFPMGLAWRDGKLYVADPPDLITLRDTDNDGRADERKVVLSSFGHVDNGSLHGLVFGPDGLLYMTTGNPDGYKLQAADGSMLTGNSGALLRCRPDGTHPEVLCRGFENLVEIAWLPGGEIIGTDNWFRKPLGGVRDALVHLVDGGLYPLHTSDSGTPQVVTGDPLPPLATFPAVALSGLMRYEGASFPPEMRGNLFVAQHNARKVVRLELTRDGATLKARADDFVTSTHPDFHPSDVLEDADGSILVIDTGGWYVQHCPTGAIRDSRAPGGIFRLRFRDAEQVADPWGLQIAYEKLEPAALAKSLLDSRPVVRRKAQHELIGRGDAVAEHLRPLLTSDNMDTQSLAAWTLAAIGTDPALSRLRELIARDPNHPAALRALAHCADSKSAAALEHWLGRCDEAAVRLALAEALGRCGTRDSVPGLLAALAKEKERFVEHALVVALHRLASREQLAAALENGEPRVQKAALLLLDQSPHQVLTASQLMARLSSDDADVRRAAQSILARHAEWGEEALRYFRVTMADRNLSAADEQRLAETIVAFAGRQEVVDWLGEALKDSPSPQRRAFVLQTMARIGRPKHAQRWIEPLRAALDDPAVRGDAVRTIATLQMPELDEAMLQVAGEDSTPAQLRLDALRGVIGRHPELSAGSFELLVAPFQSATPAPAPMRLAAAEALAKAKLSDAQLMQLMVAVQDDSLASPDTLYPLLIRSKSPATSQAIADYVARAVQKGWRPDEEKLAALPASPKVLALVRQEKDRQGERLAALEPLISGGDATRGRAIFLDKRVACATCHRVGDVGGSVGPDLTKVGAIRSGRDILESIVFPSSTFAQGYESYVLTLAGGQELTGIIAERTADSVVLRDSSGSERRIAADEIKKMRRDRVSVMPQGLDTALKPEEFRDLLAFLQSLK
jgi:putative membrane-bound dehydrogenase-like protein